jgi:hypothetical protein
MVAIDDDKIFDFRLEEPIENPPNYILRRSLKYEPQIEQRKLKFLKQKESIEYSQRSEKEGC